MNLRFVEAFIWVAHLKSITRGAKKLCLTQSAVSNRVAALEEELGVQLLDRRATEFRLTDAGTRFLEYANQLLALQSELMSELGTPEQRPFSLRVGAIESVLHTWLIPMTDDLKKKMPQIEFELTVEMTHVLGEQLRHGALDLVFSAAPVSGDGIASEILTPFEMVFVGSEKLARKKPIPLEEVLACDLMTFQRGSQPHLALVEMLRAAGFAGKHVHAISSISALIRLAESGFGIATLPRAVAKRLMSKNRISILDTGQPLPALPLFANYWDGLPMPTVKQAVELALQFAKNWAAENPSAAQA